MFYVLLALVMSPLLFGAWFVVFPRSVPFWVAQIPLAIVDVFWKYEAKSADARPRDNQFFTPIDRDPNYRDDQIDRMPGLENLSTPWNRPPPGRVQAIGFVTIVLWLAAAFALKSCAMSVAKSSRASERSTTENVAP